MAPDEHPAGQAQPVKRPARQHGRLATLYGAPPFTVLDARQGYWRDRKRHWLDLGLESELGRDERLLYDASLQPAHRYEEKAAYERQAGRQLTWPEYLAATRPWITGTSVFDPVLTELLLSWFTPPGGRVFDPFAGGSVRGIVASKLGHDYVGIELRPEQVAADERQAEDLVPDRRPCWVTGDARQALELVTGPFDGLLTCPPYHNLEVYSDDPRDLSRMPWPEFLEVYREIAGHCVDLLAYDRFASVVVGDVRDRRGCYRDLPGETVRAWVDAGAQLYNRAIYVPPLGSLPARAGRQFAASRKLGSAHQHVFVFVKGDPRAAARACDSVVLANLEGCPAGIPVT